MVGGLKTLRVKPGHEQEFELLFAELRGIMKSEEPGCRLYSLLRSRTDPRAYIVHEQYDSQVALDRHEKSEHGARFFPRIRGLLEAITVEYYDCVVE
jgi:quinol monooxygenase YgiN